MQPALPRRRAALGAVLTALALAAAGCGSGPTGPTGTAAPGTGSGPAATRSSAPGTASAGTTGADAKAGRGADRAPGTAGSPRPATSTAPRLAADPAARAALPPLGWRSGAFSGESLAEHAEFGSWRGRPLATTLWYTAQDSWAALANPAYWAVERLKDPSVTPVLSYAMWPRSERGASLARGATGAYDEHWVALAENLVKDGLSDAIIRPGWEFNGDWYPWSVRDDQGAADFAAYWRHLVDAMRSVPQQDFAFSWNPVASGGGVDPAKAYPGDAWVDDIGLDVYNVKLRADLTGAAQWQSQVRMKHGLAWHRAFAARHGKPVSFPEWGAFSRPADPALAGGDDPVFIREMFAWMRAEPPSYENYFDHDTPEGIHYGLHTDGGVMPRSAAAYTALWGR